MNNNYQTTKKERVSYGLYFFGQNVFYLFIAMFIQVFFTDIGITAAVVGIIFLIARIWDAVNDPLFGIIVDRSRLKGGRFIPWIRLSTFLIPVTTILIFVIPSSLPMVVKAILASVFYVLWDMAYTVCDAPIFALATAMTGNIQERTSLISIGRIAALVGIILINITAPILRPIIGWLGVALLFSAIGFMFMVPIGFTAKERLIVKDSDPLSIKEIFNYLKGNKYLLIFYGGMIIASLTNMSQTMGLYFARINLGNESLYALVMMASMIPMLLVSVFLPALTKKIDKFHIYMCGLIITMVLSIVSYFVGYSNFGVFIVLAALKGIGTGITMVMMFMFSADCVEYGTFKTGSRAEGITFSIQTFATKMFGAISGALGMLLLAMFGFVEGVGVVQPASAVNGIWMLYSLFPAFGSLAAFIFLSLFYKLRDKDVQIMANINQGIITRAEGEKQLSRKY